MLFVIIKYNRHFTPYSYEDANALEVPSWESEENWVMDFGCSFHTLSGPVKVN
jgi:hypothetical protein